MEMLQIVLSIPKKTEYINKFADHSMDLMNDVFSTSTHVMSRFLGCSNVIKCCQNGRRFKIQKIHQKNIKQIIAIYIGQLFQVTLTIIDDYCFRQL